MSHHGIYFSQLEDMYQRNSEAAVLRILWFPCNQFGGQEPSTEADIKDFNSTFDMFSKINANGGDAHPLRVYHKVSFHYLFSEMRGLSIQQIIKSFDKDSV